MSEDIRLLAYNKYIVNNPLYRSSISQKSRNEVILSFGSSVVWSFNGGIVFNLIRNTNKTFTNNI